MARDREAVIAHLEGVINHLWKELNSINIPHRIRLLMEHRMQEVEDELHAVICREHSPGRLQRKLKKIDLELAEAAIEQAESEISKMERESAPFQGLENVSKSLKDQVMTPKQARHEVKRITRNN